MGPTITANELLNAQFLLQVALGNVPGYQTGFLIGNSFSLDIADGEQQIWDNDFDLTPLTADTEIFMSSSNSGDTMSIIVSGLDSNFDQKFSTIALTGQTQVTIGNFRHVQSATVLGATTPSGDIYIATTDTLTAGVPDTDSTVKSKIIQGLNTTHNGFYMVPRAKMVAAVAIRGTTDANTKPVIVHTVTTADGGVPVNVTDYTVLSGFPQFTFLTPLATFNLTGGALTYIVPEKTLVQYRGEATANATKLFFGVDFLIIDDALTSLA